MKKALWILIIFIGVLFVYGGLMEIFALGSNILAGILFILSGLIISNIGYSKMTNREVFFTSFLKIKKATILGIILFLFGVSISNSEEEKKQSDEMQSAEVNEKKNDENKAVGTNEQKAQQKDENKEKTKDTAKQKLTLAKSILSELSKLSQEKDDMEDTTYYMNSYLENYTNLYQVYPYLVSATKDLTVEQLSNNPESLELYLLVRYGFYEDDWLFIKEFAIKTDQKKYEVDDIQFGEWKRDNDGDKVWEWYTDQLSVTEDLEMYNDMAKSSSITIRYRGDEYYDDHQLGTNELNALKQIIPIFKKYQKLYALSEK